MSEERFDESAVFEKARSLSDPSERKIYLEEVCRGDSSRLERLQALLTADLQGEALLDDAVLAPTVDSAFAQPGMQIGPYKLLQKIGEGGMGVVYMAEQTHPVERRVALKIIKPGMDSKSVIARFEAERQALALMDHPNIARVLDAGTNQFGHPYFVMEIVKGVAITDYCDQRRLSPRERLELFVPVCQAIQHAHQKGIIHRDIKPSNVLVAEYDDHAVPKIIDFGVAKATQKRLTEKTLFTGFGQVVGTFDYMSPEQTKLNQLDIDTRSDIYSLGVLLYELLTGCTPFDRRRFRAAAFDEILRIIRDEEPPRPSLRASSANTLPSIAASRHVDPRELTRQLRGDLDWIVMKALEKDRVRRYETANGLAADLKRHLCDEPISARPPSTVYRLVKFARRNRVAFAIGSVAALALIAFAAVSASNAVKFEALANRETMLRQEANEAAIDADQARQREVEERRVAEQQRALAEQQKTRAEDNFALAESAVDQFLSSMADSELANVPGLQLLREQLLESALQFYAELTARAGGDEFNLESARAFQQIAAIRSELGQTNGALEANIKSIALFEELRKEKPNERPVLLGLATALFQAGRHSEVVQLCKQILETEPKNSDTRELLGDAYNEIAVGFKANDANESLRYHRLAYALREQLMDETPERTDHAGKLGGTINNIGVLLAEKGSRAEALTEYKNAAKYLRIAHARSPQTLMWGRWLCNCIGNAANISRELNENQEALALLEELVAVRQGQAFRHPAILSLRVAEYQDLVRLSEQQRRMELNGESKQSLRKASTVLENLPRDSAEQMLELAAVYGVLAEPVNGFDQGSQMTLEQTQYAKQALQWAHKAIEKGYRNVSMLRESARFASLRKLPQFSSEIEELDKRIREEDRIAKDVAESARLADLKRREDIEAIEAELNKAGQTRDQLIRKADQLERIASLGAGSQGGSPIDSLQQALGIRKLLSERFPEDTKLKLKTFSTGTKLGLQLWGDKRYSEAHQVWQRVLDDSEQFAISHLNNDKALLEISNLQRKICENYGHIGLWDYAVREIEGNLKTGKIWNSDWDSRFVTALAASGRFDEHTGFFQLYERTYGWNGIDDVSDLLWAAAMNPKLTIETPRRVKLAYDFLRSPDDDAVGFALSGHRIERFRAATALVEAGQAQLALDTMLPSSSDLFCYHGAAYRYWLALTRHSLGEFDNAETWLTRAEWKFGSFTRAVLQSPDGKIPTWGFMRNWRRTADDHCSRRLAFDAIHPSAEYRNPWLHLQRASGLRLLGEYENAALSLERARSEAERDPIALAFHALVFAKLNHSNEDLATAWQEALDAADAEPLPWILAGKYYTEVGNESLAEEYFSRAAELCPNDLDQFIQAGIWVAGPYGSPLDGVRAPQLLDSPGGSISVTDNSRGWKSLQIPWPTAPVWNRDEFSPEVALEVNSGTAYLMAYVYSPNDRTEILRLETRFSNKGVGIRVWVNRRSAYRTDEKLWVENQGDAIPISLKKGKNVLLLKMPLESNPNDFSIKISLGDSPTNRAILWAQQRRWSKAASAIKQQHVDWERWIGSGDFVRACRLSLFDQSDGIVGQYGDELAMTAISGPDTYRSFRAAEILALHAGVPFEKHRERITLELQRLMRTETGEVTNSVRQALVLFYLAAGDINQASHLVSELERSGDSIVIACLRSRVFAAKGMDEEAFQALDAAFRFTDEDVADNPTGAGEPLGGRNLHWHKHVVNDGYLMTTERAITGSTLRFDKLTAERETDLVTETSDLDLDTSAFDHHLLVNMVGKAGSIATSKLFRGKRYLELGLHDLAEREYTQALELESGSIEALTARARLRASTNNVDGAAQDFMDAYRAASAAVEKPSERLRVLSDLVRYPRVIAKLRRLEPLSTDWAKADARHALMQGDWTTAVQKFEESDGTWEHVICGAALRALMEDESRHLATCERLDAVISGAQDDRLTSESRKAWFRAFTLGLRPLDREHQKQMLTLAQIAAESKEQAPQNQFLLGLAHLRNGDFIQSQQLLERATLRLAEPDGVDRFAKNGYRWAAMALACHETGRKDEARKYLDRCEDWLDLTEARYKAYQEGDIDAGMLLGDMYHLMAFVMIKEAKWTIDGYFPKFLQPNLDYGLMAPVEDRP